MGFWKSYFRKIWKAAAAVCLMWAVTGIVFFLYDVPLEPVLYSGVLGLLIGFAAVLWGYGAYGKRMRQLREIKDNLAVCIQKLPPPSGYGEALYQEMLKSLNAERMRLENSRSIFYTELTDYYTMWVHQIKTPIAAARLLLQENGEGQQAALSELFKIEEYVEMVLGYLRTEDMSADMNFMQCSLDEIVRGQIHKFARIFIQKKLSLEYAGTEETVLTDSKWLGFVIGQLLSNALKYTKSGKISIYLSQSRPHTLVIEDTGIGIRREDLPRVFEKGFTGYNGRGESRSTGIGLYLCAKIMKKLNHTISLDSEPGKGTRVFLSLARGNLDID